MDLEITATDLIQGHTVTTRAEVSVTSDDESPVFAGSPVANPVSPAYVDVEITWSASVSDAETGGDVGEVIQFTWDWDDGTYDVDTQDPTAEGAEVTDVQVHTWDTDGTYRVTVWAWDGYDDELNEFHNVSVYRDYVIMTNTAPSAVSIADVTWSEDSYAPVVGTAIDLDPDTLTFTWDWDDGTFNVTEVDNTDPGTQVTNSVKHLWADQGTYTVTLYVDDGMLHNVTTTTEAVISAIDVNIGPTALQASYAPDPGLAGETITFTVGAADANEDALEFWIDFGDGSDPETADSVGGTTDVQSVTFEHAYESEGTYQVTYSANDSEADEVFSTIDVQVVVNDPPELSLQSAYTATYNQEFTIAPALCEDPEGDEITVWYDFGDETPLVKGGDIASNYEAAHTYADIGTFELTAYADDGMTNNVSATTNVTVRESNLKPTVVSIVMDPEGPYEKDQEITFTVTVKDLEGDTVTVEIFFGDGETDTAEVETEPNNTAATVEFTHAYAEWGMTYTVTVNATDEMDHSDPAPSTKTTTVVIDPEPGSNLAIYVALGVLAIVAVLAALLLMRRKKKGAMGEGGSMEGMAPPEPPPSG